MSYQLSENKNINVNQNIYNLVFSLVVLQLKMLTSTVVYYVVQVTLKLDVLLMATLQTSTSTLVF